MRLKLFKNSCCVITCNPSHWNYSFCDVSELTFSASPRICTTCYKEANIFGKIV